MDTFDTHSNFLGPANCAEFDTHSTLSNVQGVNNLEPWEKFYFNTWIKYYKRIYMFYINQFGDASKLFEIDISIGNQWKKGIFQGV